MFLKKPLTLCSAVRNVRLYCYINHSTTESGLPRLPVQKNKTSVTSDLPFSCALCTTHTDQRWSHLRSLVSDPFDMVEIDDVFTLLCVNEVARHVTRDVVVVTITSKVHIFTKIGRISQTHAQQTTSLIGCLVMTTKRRSPLNLFPSDSSMLLVCVFSCSCVVYHIVTHLSKERDTFFHRHSSRANYYVTITQ